MKHQDLNNVVSFTSLLLAIILLCVLTLIYRETPVEEFERPPLEVEEYVDSDLIEEISPKD